MGYIFFMQCAPIRSFPWHLVHVEPDSAFGYRLELHRGEGEHAEVAYIAVQAWPLDLGDRLEVIGVVWVPAGDPISESAAQALREQPEAWLADVVLRWRGRAVELEMRRAS